VIHAHWLVPQGLVALILGRLSRRPTPYLVTSHGADLYALRGRGLNSLKRIVLDRAAAVSVVSKAMVEELACLGANAKKVSVQPMGVDLQERFTLGIRGRRSADEILFVGRLVEKKGLRHLIDAMPAILLARPSAFLTVVGFGPEEATCRAQVQRLGLESTVKFVGAKSQTDIPAFYRRAAVFAAPFVEAVSGDREGLGLVLVEAAGCGCPVVVSDLPAVRDVMQAGAGCVRVVPSDSVALAAAIVDVIGHLEVHRQGVEASRDQLVQRFDWASVSQRYGNLLEACVEDTK
jgi:glycosyltransferase involved in cell wall biosynthesis